MWVEWTPFFFCLKRKGESTMERVGIVSCSLISKDYGNRIMKLRVPEWDFPLLPRIRRQLTGWLPDCSWLIKAPASEWPPKSKWRVLYTGVTCPFACSVFLLLREKFLFKIDRQFQKSHPAQMATLKMFLRTRLTPPSSPPASCSSLFPPFSFWDLKKISLGPPLGAAQARVHLPAIIDHKSLWWMEPLPSVVQGFDCVLGRADLRAGL